MEPTGLYHPPNSNTLDPQAALIEVLSLSAQALLDAEGWKAGLDVLVKSIGRWRALSWVYVFANETGPTGKAFARPVSGWSSAGITQKALSPGWGTLSLWTGPLARWGKLLSQSKPVYGLSMISRSMNAPCSIRTESSRFWRCPCLVVLIGGACWALKTAANHAPGLSGKSTFTSSWAGLSAPPCWLETTRPCAAAVKNAFGPSQASPPIT